MMRISEAVVYAICKVIAELVRSISFSVLVLGVAAGAVGATIGAISAVGIAVIRLASGLDNPRLCAVVVLSLVGGCYLGMLVAWFQRLFIWAFADWVSGWAVWGARGRKVLEGSTRDV